MNTDPQNIFANLKQIAPEVVFSSVWSYDEIHRRICPSSDIFDKGGALENEDPNDWQSWQATVSAQTIHKGAVLVEETFLGGIWEKFGDNPHETNSDVSGYLPQMLKEVSESLASQLGSGHVSQLLQNASAYLARVLRARYEAQRATAETSATTTA